MWKRFSATVAIIVCVGTCGEGCERKTRNVEPVDVAPLKRTKPRPNLSALTEERRARYAAAMRAGPPGRWLRALATGEVEAMDSLTFFPFFYLKSKSTKDCVRRVTSTKHLGEWVECFARSTTLFADVEIDKVADYRYGFDDAPAELRRIAADHAPRGRWVYVPIKGQRFHEILILLRAEWKGHDHSGSDGVAAFLYLTKVR